MNIETVNLWEEYAPLSYVNAHYIVAHTNADTSEALSQQILSMQNLMKHVPVPVFVTGTIPDADRALRWLEAGAARLFLPTECEERNVIIAALGEQRVLKDLNEITPRKAAFSWKDMKLNSDGMVPVVVQDYLTDQVLMVAYMNEEAFEATLRTGHMVYYSRSRQELWEKGLTSGHLQFVKSLMLDCDNDTILAKVAQIGAACHTGSYSCFFQTILEEEFSD